jgi:aspartyl-tRNA(Asn)/glutamyl-tRNA(Gln) amidotransferase subunit A
LHASDPDCVDAPFAASSLDPTDVTDLAGLRIGVVRAGHFPEGADPALADVFDAAVAQLGALGADPVEVELPFLTQMLTADIVTMACEALAYHRTDMTHRWDDYFVATRVMLAQGALVSGADYVQAQRMRRAAQLALGRLFEQIDVVVCPTISVGAPPLAGFLDGTDDVMALFSFIHTGYWDSVGNPVLALPMGETAAGMPLSLQIAGRPFEEATILRAGAAFQGCTDHHLRVPGLALAGAELAA